MPLSEEQRNAQNPEWDPVYGYEKQQRGQEQVGDALTLGLGGFRDASAREAATRQLMGLGLPEFSQQGYQYIGDYTPEAIGTPEAAQASLASDAGEGKDAQLAALRRLLEQSDQSVGSQQALDRYRAEQDASQFANSREQAIRQDAMAHGRVGSAQDMIARQQAAQAGANQNLNAGMQSAQMAALQRLAGTQAYGQLGSQVRGQDQGLAFRNQDAINQFNLANVGARNAVNLQNVTNRNEAAQLNRSGAQQVMNQNVGRRDDITNAMQGADLARRSAIANALTGQAVGQGAGDARRTQAGEDALAAFARFYGAGSAGSKK